MLSFCNLPPDGLQRVKRRAVVFQLFFIAGKRVEIREVVFLVKELLRIVLAVDVDEPCAQLFKRRHAYRPPVYAADIFSVRVNFWRCTCNSCGSNST